LIIEAVTTHSGSRLVKLLDEVILATSKKSRTIQILDQVGQWFLIVVLGVALLIWAYFVPTLPAEGLKRALAFLLVTCPCTFAFAVPLVYALAVNRSAQAGVLIKHPNLFENLLKIKTVLLDKTGTMTDGQYEVQEFAAVKGADVSSQDLARLLKITKASQHPVSKALARYLAAQGITETDEEPSEQREEPVIGLKAKFLGAEFLVRANEIIKNNQVIYRLSMGDKILPDTKKVVSELKVMGLSVHIVSGDDSANVLRVSDAIGLEPAHVHAQATPKDKQKLVRQYNPVLMLGDGANDSLALAEAQVGIAAHGSLVSSLKASDAYFLSHSLSSLLTLFTYAQKVKRAVWRNLFIAVIYNFVAGGLVLTGHIHPLLAAVLMPMSSVTQLASTLLAMQKSEIKV
jgi:P-type E1-E2 ATPase